MSTEQRTDDGSFNASAIKHWPKCERPREKMQLRGPEHLSDSELLALLINTGTGGSSAVDLARTLLAKYGSLRSLSRRPMLELQQLHGIGPARAALIMTAFEVGRRTAAEPDTDDPGITSPEDVAKRYIPRMRDLPTERFVVLLMNNSGRVVREHTVSEGIVNASLVHPREVFRPAVTELATSVILLHNHPSAVREASAEDHRITKQLVHAGRLMDIPVQDHVIICGNSYISFAEQGWLE